MRKVFLPLLLLLLAPSVCLAADMSTTVPSGSQYAPGNTYGFQINCGDIESVTSVLFEWNGMPNQSASGTYPNFYINVVDVPAGEYSYKWFVQNATDTFAFTNTYSVAKSEGSQLSLKFDGTEADKSYKQNTIAKFTVNLNIPNSLVRLESTYPGFVTKTNTTSYIYYSFNLTEYGIYTATASWDGNQNYSAKSITRKFDSGPPKFSSVVSFPEGPVGYSSDTTYKFQISCSDATLSKVWFESNYTGSMKTYDSKTTPALQNSSDTYWIELGNLGARNFSFRWHAKDSLNTETVTEFFNYRILKMNPLVMELLPSIGIREGMQVTASCNSINPLQINSSKFYFFKDSEPIDNTSTSVKLGVFLMTSGSHNFTCYTPGNQNYTNQSITKIVVVESTPYVEEEKEGIFEAQSITFDSVVSGTSGQGSIRIRNGLFKNLFNITAKITGVPSGWYSIETVGSLYSGESEILRATISVPSDAEAKDYPLSVEIQARNSDGTLISKKYSSSLSVKSPAKDMTPTYSSATASKDSSGSSIFFSIRIADDNEVSGYIFSTNSTGQWVNQTWTPLSDSANWINITKSISSQESDVVAWKVYANDSSNQWSSSGENIVLSMKSETEDYTLIIAAGVIILASAIIVVIVRGRKPIPNTEYVYSEDDLNE